MSGAKLTISSRNYSSWSLRAWLFCQMAGLDVEVESTPMDDPTNRAELLQAFEVCREVAAEVGVIHIATIEDQFLGMLPDEG